MVIVKEAKVTACAEGVRKCCDFYGKHTDRADVNSLNAAVACGVVVFEAEVQES